MKNLDQAKENSGMRATNEKNPDKSRSESSFFDNPILNEQKTLSKISELDEKNQEILVRRVFEHSVSDGLKLTTERLYTNRDYLDLISRFSFYIKHQDLAQNLIREAKREVKSDKDKSELEKLEKIYKQYEEDLSRGDYMGHLNKEEREDATTGLKAKESLAEIDNWYSQFLKNKKVKDIYNNDYRSKGEQLGESVINKMKFSLENNYYKDDIYDILIKHISAHSSEDMGEIVKNFFNQNKNLKERYKDGGVDLYLKKIRKGDEDKQIFGDFILEKSLNKKDLEKARTESFFSEDTVKKIVDYFQIDSDLKIKNAIYKPLDITTEMETKMAEKKLIKEISENGDEIIWNEQTQKYEIKGSGSEQKETKYLTEEKILDKLEQFIKDGANKRRISYGLAGLDSDRAWQMREEFIQDGVGKDWIALGLAGDHTSFVWQLKKRDKQEVVINNSLERRDLNKEELRKAILKYLEEDSTLATKNKKTINGHKLASFINTTIKETPELFLKTIVAKKDNRILTTKLVHKSFPSTQIEEKNTWRGFSGYSGFGGGSSFNKEPRPEDYLNPDSREQMMGGNPESGGGREEGKEILRFRESFNDLMILGIYGRLSGINWDPAYQFPIAKQKIVKSKEITVSLPNVGEKVKLPKPIGGNIVLERVKGIIKKEEFPLEMDLSPMREGVVRDTKKAEEVVYSIEVDEIPRVMSEVSQNEYEDYKNKFTRNNGKDMLESIGALPEEIDIFLDQIKDKNPKEKVKLIEDFVRSICHYDMKNGEMMGLKVNKDFEERLAIMESRVEELKTKGGDKESFSGKKYAGVCADFAMLSAAILRRAGFVSGVLSCLVPTDQKATASDAHATAFVVWPNSSKENEIFSVDGTPNGVEGISAPSIREKEEARDEIVKQIEEKAEEELDEMIQKLDSYSDEEIEALSNGKLENILNIILRYGVSQNNLQVITGLLNSYWYSPLNKLNLDDVEDRVDFLKFFEGEANRAKNEPAKEIETDAGGKLFETIENFVQRFSKGQKRENGFETIDKIKELFNPVLSENEKKALSATITYLKAKKMK